MHVNIRLWPLMARTGLHTLFGAGPKCDLEVGFTIEGRSDDELPEVLLGGARLHRLKIDELPMWPGAPSPRHGGSASPKHGRRLSATASKKKST